MPLEVGKRYRVKGQVVRIQDSNAQGKEKAAVTSEGRIINFGSSESRIRPGTPAGDQYCARSAGIRSSDNLSPNDLARADWHCDGSVSKEEGPTPLDD
jgi:hypothetical protein